MKHNKITSAEKRLFPCAFLFFLKKLMTMKGITKEQQA